MVAKLLNAENARLYHLDSLDNTVIAQSGYTGGVIGASSGVDGGSPTDIKSVSSKNNIVITNQATTGAKGVGGIVGALLSNTNLEKAYVYGGSADNSVRVRGSVAVGGIVGLVGEEPIDGTSSIKEAYVTDYYVDGFAEVGGAIGKISSNVDNNIKLEDIYVMDSGVASAYKYGAGLFGLLDEAESLSETVTITNSFLENTSVTGKSVVGATYNVVSGTNTIKNIIALNTSAEDTDAGDTASISNTSGGTNTISNIITDEVTLS